jgi:hypothetical protein
MRVVRLQAENFQILKAIEIIPGYGPVIVGGKNEQGKSSIMDAIWVALGGKSAAPPQPIRKDAPSEQGVQQARIVLDIGEYVVERTFKSKDGAPYTDSIKLLDDRGRIVPKPQQVLNDLLGAIGFDPFAFTKLKPEDQAEQLLGLVALPIDLEDFASEDAADYATRRDVNRQAEALAARIAAIPLIGLEGDAPDKDKLTEQLASAADHNGAIERERMAREQEERRIEGVKQSAEDKRETAQARRDQAKRLIEEAEALEAAGLELDNQAVKLGAALQAREPLAEPIDTQAVRQQLQAAEADLAERERQRRRRELLREHEDLLLRSKAFTAAMEDRERQRQEALASAKMPVEGLGFSINEKGKPVVTWQGLPFAQASTAAQIRTSTAIAMAANPELRILRIKDGSLLDDDMMGVLVSMAESDDFQLWIEVVGTGAAGIIIENGEIKSAPAEAEEKPKAKAKVEKPAAAEKLL